MSKPNPRQSGTLKIWGHSCRRGPPTVVEVAQRSSLDIFHALNILRGSGTFRTASHESIAELTAEIPRVLAV